MIVLNTKRSLPNSKLFILLAILTLTTIHCSSTFAQIPDTNYIPTHKDVLKYLYEQDVDCKYLEKDTLKKAKEIRLLNDVIDEQNETYKDCNERIQIEKERNSANNITIQSLKDANKKTSKRLIIVSGIAIITNVVKSFFIVKLALF